MFNPSRVVRLREKLDLTQSDLAKKTRLHPSAISHFETGGRDPSAANLVKMADALECSADYLLDRDGYTPTAASPRVHLLMSKYEQLSEHDRQNLVTFAEMLAKPKGKRG